MPIPHSLMRGVACALMLVVRPAAGQAIPDAVRIPDDPVCAQCNISARVVTTIVQPAESYARPMVVRADRRGRYWLLRELDVPLVFDSTGRFLQVVGRKGSGPGEYANPEAVLFAGDSAVVFDAFNARATILDASLSPRRYVRAAMRVMNPVAIAWPSAVIAYSQQQGAANTGPLSAFSLASDQLTVSKSFGPSEAMNTGQTRMTSWHLLSEPIGGSFWTAWQYGYNLSEWASDGTLMRRFERRPPWFSGSEPSRIGGPNKAPDSFIRGVERDANGLIWVFISTAGKNWQAGWPMIAPGQREVRGSDMVYGSLFDTMVEVIDPRTARVVARDRFDGYAMSILTGRRAAFLEQTSYGDERIVVREFRLSGR